MVASTAKSRRPRRLRSGLRGDEAIRVQRWEARRGREGGFELALLCLWPGSLQRICKHLSDPAEARSILWLQTVCSLIRRTRWIRFERSWASHVVTWLRNEAPNPRAPAWHFDHSIGTGPHGHLEPRHSAQRTRPWAVQLKAATPWDEKPR